MDRSLVPRTASRQAAVTLVGQPEPPGEVVGRPGRAPPPAECPPGPPRRRPGRCSRHRPRRRACRRRTRRRRRSRRCRSAARRRRTRAGARRSAPPRSTPRARLPPERPSSASASGRPGVFPDASVPAMLLDPMGAQARVFVTRQLPGEALDRLVARARRGGLARARLPPPRTELLARAPELEGLLSLLTDPVDAELIDAAPKLRAISNYAVGVDNVDVEAAAARGIPVGNTPGRAHRVDRGPGRGADARHRAAARPRARRSCARASGARGSRR